MKTTNIVNDNISFREVGENATAMSIDDSSTVFLMDMLGKLYARPALAVLREYLSNAYDAHVAKGGELPPIEIALPNDRSKLLSIRDFGNGMSEEQFSTILSRYGNSTKRDSNEFIGGFGLGAKAGFALSNEFFMTSYQNGKGLRVRFYKDVKSQGYVEITERFQTSEPDGMLVEVKIPQSNLDEYSDNNITTLLMAYSPEDVQVIPTRKRKYNISLMNPDDFASLELNGNIVGWIGKQSTLKKTGSHRNESDIYMVIGKVVYGMNFGDIISKTDDKELEEFIHYIKNSIHRHAINIPIGSVDLPSSREEIILSERSLQTLRGALANHVRLVHSHFQSEINKMDYLPAMRKIAFFEGEYYPKVDSFTWRGKSLGAELLASSKMFATVAQNIRKYKFYTTPVSRYESASSFLEAILPTITVTKSFVVVADTEADAHALSSNLTESVVKGILLEMMPKNRKENAFHSSFLIVTKDDPLYELVSHFPELDHSVIETQLAEVEKLKQQAAERWKQRHQEKLNEEAARKAENARMLHTFFLHDPAAPYHGGEFYEKESPEKIFNDDNIAEVKYYWSEEELLTLNKKVTPAFPYEVKENNYSTRSDTEYNPTLGHTAIYHQKLRAFLQHFLVPGARVILLNTDVDLENFKTQHPEVRSGVNVVKTSVEAQLKDENSDLMILRGVKVKNYRVSNTVPEQVTRFYSLLSEQQEQQLHPNFVEVVNSLEQIYRLKKQSQYLNEHYLEELLPVFCADVPTKPDIWAKHENLEEKYPLFFFGPHFSKKVISELIDYINMKNA